MPTPTLTRRIWVPGVEYSGETPEAAEAREQLFRDEDAAAEREAARLAAWAARLWWEDPPSEPNTKVQRTRPAVIENLNPPAPTSDARPGSL